MLVSYLATRVTTLPFINIETLVLNTDYKIALIPGTIYEDTFRYVKNPIWIEAFKTRIEPYLDEYYEFPDIIDLALQRSDFAVWSDALTYRFYYNLVSSYRWTLIYLFYFRSSSYFIKCELVTIPAKYDYNYLAFAVQKNSPYLGIFNYYMRHLKENGVLKQILSKYQPQAQVCPDYSGKALGFNSTFTGFVPLFAGASLALLLLILEYVWLFISYTKPLRDRRAKNTKWNQFRH